MWSETAEPLKSCTIDSEIKPEITREISEFLCQKSLKNVVIIEPTVYMTAVTHRNYKSTEIRIINQQKSVQKSTEIGLEVKLEIT